MKPDWQNKSYAKNGAVTGPSTTHPKLKIGMSSLHSKIAVANHNTVQAKMPAVRKFADGGAVMTRSDDEIGDTNPRTGKVDPGSYDRRMAQGEKNLQALKDAFNRFTGDKAATQNVSSDANAEYKAGGESDAAKAKIISAAMDKKPDTVITEEPRRRQISDYMVKRDAEEVKAEAAPAPAAPAPAPAAESAKPVAKKPAAKPVVEKNQKPVSKIYNEDGMPNSESSSASNLQDSSRSMSAKPVSKVNKTPNTAARMSPVGNSQKDIEARILANKGLAGNEAMKREIEQDSKTDTGDETKRLRDRTSTFVPGFGQVDKEGKIIPNVRGGRMASQVYGAKEDSFMESAEKRYLKSRIDAGNMTAMEKAQAKRAGLI